jgi:hypothetical protein
MNVIGVEIQARLFARLSTSISRLVFVKPYFRMGLVRA